MSILKKGIFTLNLGLLQIQTEISEEDRQCAWELYTEICTRLALTGKKKDPECKDFSGEVLIESLESVYSFFKEARKIMRKFPVGKLERNVRKHLGVLINDLMVNVLRPFLEKWQADFRHWWNNCDENLKKLPPFERQKKYPRYKEFINDWRNMRLLMRELQKELVKAYLLVDVDKASRFLPMNRCEVKKRRI